MPVTKVLDKSVGSFPKQPTITNRLGHEFTPKQNTSLLENSLILSWHNRVCTKTFDFLKKIAWLVFKHNKLNILQIVGKEVTFSLVDSLTFLPGVLKTILGAGQNSWSVEASDHLVTSLWSWCRGWLLVVCIQSIVEEKCLGSMSNDSLKSKGMVCHTWRRVLSLATSTCCSDVSLVSRSPFSTMETRLLSTSSTASSTRSATLSEYLASLTASIRSSNLSTGEDCTREHPMRKIGRLVRIN